MFYAHCNWCFAAGEAREGEVALYSTALHFRALFPTFRFAQSEFVDLQIYSTILALGSVLANPRWSRISIRHLNTILLATLSVYTYRDIYPLGTYVLTPQDKLEGPLLWVKISLLAVAAVVIPLIVPRKYIPVDPKVSFNRPNQCITLTKCFGIASNVTESRANLFMVI